MHPPRRNGATEPPKISDRLADWLLSHIPISTLTLLTLLVTSPLGIPRPWQIFPSVVTADVVISLIRWRRRAKRSDDVEPMRRGVAA